MNLDNQGRAEKLKRGGERILRKIYYFSETLKKMSERGGGEGPSPHPSLRLCMLCLENGLTWFTWLYNRVIALMTTDEPNKCPVER